MELLYPIIILNSVVGGLGLMLVIADRFLAQYGDCRIRINEEKEVVVKGGDSLLASLIDNEIFIPSACGGRGTCGYCQVRVPEGGGPVLLTEEPLLTREQLINRYHLACQMKVRQDLKIEIPEEWLTIQKYRAQVVSTKPVTPTIKEIVLNLLEPDSIKFKPGQYVQVKIPAGRGFEYRAYSIASETKYKDRIMLDVRLIEGGLGSTYLHSLKEGDEVEFVGPYGEFVVKDTDKEIICVAGGVGLCPIRSIISSMLDEGTDRKITLFYGARQKRDLYHYEQLKKLEEKHKNFHFVPALDTPEPEWEGEVGLITNVMERYLAKDGADNMEAYLCGPQAMMYLAIEILTNLGVKEEDIRFDKF
jgi:Na+-transporting NADH:ubiquinone oxidoreductase subunit F